VDRCCQRLAPLLQVNLAELLFQTGNEAREELLKPRLWQPAMFVTQYAIGRLWMSWGVKPAAIIGHSLGVYVAATLAGVFELDDALTLMVECGRRTEKLEPGAMLALPASERYIQHFLKGRISLAAVNAPELCLVSGPLDEINSIEHELAHLNPIRLAVSHAFHSSMVDPLIQPLTEVISNFRLNPPCIPYLSNVTGTWIRDEEATDPLLWARHLRSTVRFHDCLSNAIQEPGRILLEVGPSEGLTELINCSFPTVAPIPSIAGEPDGRAIAGAVGRIWSEGVTMDWSAYYCCEKRNRVTLPTYPFERQSYWAKPSGAQTLASAPETRRETKDWLYLQTWKKSQIVQSVTDGKSFIGDGPWLIFSDKDGIAASVAQKLREMGENVTEVWRSGSFVLESTGRFSLNACSPQEYTSLLNALQDTGHFPRRILYGWAVLAAEDPLVDFESLIYLGQSLGQTRGESVIRLVVLTANLHRIHDEELADPAKAAVLGVVHVLPKENPRLACQVVDLNLAEANTRQQIVKAVLEEFANEKADTVVAYRSGRRWIPIYDAISAPPNLYSGQAARM
jgi:acyl transferase domain-containing protein